MRLIADLGHTAFAVRDVATSLAFYAKLGIHEAFRLHHEDGSLMLVYLHIAGDRFLEIFPGDNEPDPERPGSYVHLCLLTEDLRKTVTALRNAGVTLDREPARGYTTNLQAWIKDPDGNAIELMELNPGSLQWRAGRGETVQESSF